ncbi:MAG TPA: 30S ribosome-binding factor RbfA [Gammaproteobacteria bacterium]|nr:30S ribosome-binding factor RbfA [Gammaproteobacteria bacterium]
MAKEFSRAERLGGQIQKELAVLLQSGIRDPRLRFVTVSHVSLSRDLAHAKVYVSMLAQSGEVNEVVRALNHAAAYLRRQLGRRIVTRIVPDLQFIYDDSMEQGNRVAALIEGLKAGQPNDKE